jgi:peptidoglycan hydrolase-like protein with peptidoglycan-binding domain
MEAVREFQKSIGINPIGVVGPRTRAALQGKEFLSNRDYVFTKDLKQGDRDPEVFQLQTRLQDQAFFPAYQRKTTYFGSITQRSLTLFQKFFGVVADGLGIFGAKTREFMNPVK